MVQGSLAARYCTKLRPRTHICTCLAGLNILGVLYFRVTRPMSKQQIYIALYIWNEVTKRFIKARANQKGAENDHKIYEVIKPASYACIFITQPSLSNPIRLFKIFIPI